MALARKSLVKEYDDFTPFDPSFKPFPEKPAAEAEDDVIAAYKKALDEHRAVIRRCRETGDWSELVVEGMGAPTKFRMRHLNGDEKRELLDFTQTDAQVGTAAAPAVWFRAGLVGVTNLGTETGATDKVEVQRVKVNGLSFHIASAEVPNILDADPEHGMSIVSELGGEVFRRAMALSPRR